MEVDLAVKVNIEKAWGIYAKNREVLIDHIRGTVSLPVLTITMPCNHSVVYETSADIPDSDVPCPCGKPDHWFIQYSDTGRRQYG